MEDDILKCELCPFESFQEGRLGLHKLLVHGVNKFNCDECPFEGASQESLTNHTDGVHAKIKDHVCEICEEAFSQMADLKNHKE